MQSRTEEQLEAVTWEGFKDLFREQYVPQIEVEWLTGEFLQMEQTTESVKEITDKFLEKSLFCPEYMANEKMNMYRYVNVLKIEIHKFVVMTRCSDFNQMHEVARARELELEKQSKKRKSEQTQVSSKKFKQTGHKSEMKVFPKCQRCGRNHPCECRAGSRDCCKYGKSGPQ